MRIRYLTVLGLLSMVLMAASAAASPWDIGGKIPPSKTKKPKKNDPDCEQSYANDKPKSGDPLVFAVQPRLTGDIGSDQTLETIPDNETLRDAALAELKGTKRLKLRLNRLFMSDGNAGITEFKAMADHYAALGYEIELQVRYHPADADNGDIKKWLRFVRKAVKAFGPNKSVIKIQIANEVNVDYSKNTSDGFYDKAVDAMVEGMIEADRVSKKLGYKHQKFGFNYFWRSSYAPNDSEYWRAIRKKGGKKLVKATDWIGIDIYPGTFVPGLIKPATITDIGDAFLEGVAQTRECLMPLGGFGMSTPLQIHEAAYPTGPDRSEADQDAALQAFVKTTNKYRGTYNITDFMWFNLRDNNSAGPNYQTFFGLLRDDYTHKPAFDSYKALIEKYGAK